MRKKYLLVGVVASFLGCATTEENKHKAYLHLELGTTYLNQGLYPQALGELLKAAELDPDNSKIQNNLAIAFYVRGKLEDAVTHFEKALRLESAYTEARNNYGRTLIDMGKFDDGLRELQVATKDLTYPNPERVYLNLGIGYLKKRDFRLAEKSLLQSIEIKRDNCQAYNFYGQVFYAQAKFTKALESFDKALALCHNRFDEAHFYSAMTYLKMGDQDRAITRFQEVIGIYPHSQYADQALAVLNTIR